MAGRSWSSTSWTSTTNGDENAFAAVTSRSASASRLSTDWSSGVAASAAWRCPMASAAMAAASSFCSGLRAEAAERSVVRTLSCTIASTWTRSTSVACWRTAVA
ncbi:hypothetical protein [Leifsonia sp. CL147]|uniref:hypothetical protein n=1 Tax=Leifsonia sp. CL147 TaxID=1798215 RepID=UPI00147DDDCE|nr:hypothetical protein [Leifsonia sp. CL147]